MCARRFLPIRRNMRRDRGVDSYIGRKPRTNSEPGFHGSGVFKSLRSLMRLKRMSVLRGRTPPCTGR